LKKAVFFFALIIISKTVSAAENPKEKMIDSSDSSAVILSGENGNQENEEQITWHQMFTHLPSDYISFFHNSFNSQEIPSFLSVGALTGTFMLIDQQGWNFNNLYFRKSSAVHNISNITVNVGDGRYQLAAAALFAIPGIVLHDRVALKTASNITEAVIATGLFVQILKRMTGRQSPSASTESGGDWDPFPSFRQYQKNQPAFYSFPSGHLSTTTAVVTIIANNYPNLKWVKPVGYSLLAILSLSLVNESMHWYSDLPLAFFLGYTFGNIIAPVRNTTSADVHSSNSHLFVSPSYFNNKIFLSAVYNF
jgi:membrane-associated PAP2 superfamily phosphatase